MASSRSLIVDLIGHFLIGVLEVVSHSQQQGFDGLVWLGLTCLELSSELRFQLFGLLGSRGLLLPILIPSSFSKPFRYKDQFSEN